MFSPREETSIRNALGVLFVLSISHCTTGGCRESTQVSFFAVDGDEISAADQRTIRTIAADAVDEARRYLPQMPTPVLIRVQPGRDVIPETGENGTGTQPNEILWTVDIHHPGGVQRVAKTWLRACLLHELHHLVRDAVIARDSMLDIAVTEGMATAFERDVAHVAAPWGQYPADVASWVDELRALPGDMEHRRVWMQRHPDGRRWIANRAGVYLVDRAMRASGRSAAELVRTDTQEIMRLAQSAEN